MYQYHKYDSKIQLASCRAREASQSHLLPSQWHHQFPTSFVQRGPKKWTHMEPASTWRGYVSIILLNEIHAINIWQPDLRAFFGYVEDRVCLSEETWT